MKDKLIWLAVFYDKRLNQRRTPIFPAHTVKRQLAISMLTTNGTLRSFTRNTKSRCRLVINGHVVVFTQSRLVKEKYVNE